MLQESLFNCCYFRMRCKSLAVVSKSKSESHSVVSDLCNPIDCSLPCFSVHGILQARILEWVAMPSSRASFQPRDQTPVSCIAGRFFRVTCLGLGNTFFFNLQTKATIITTLQLNYISPTILLGICCKDACSTTDEMVAQTD